MAMPAVTRTGVCANAIESRVCVLTLPLLNALIAVLLNYTAFSTQPHQRAAVCDPRSESCCALVVREPAATAMP